MSCCETTSASKKQPDLRLLNSTENLPRAELLLGSRVLENGLVQTDFVVPGMHCVGCINSIERSISELKFVEKVRANLSLKKVSVIWHEEQGEPILIDQALSDLGFDHSLFDLETDVSSSQKEKGRSLLMALGVAGFGAANIMLLSVSIWSGADAETTKLFHLISGLVAIPVVAFAGRPFFSSALQALRAKRLNMDVPISLAVLLALVMSVYESLTGGADAYFDAAVTLLFFLLIGRYLDHLMREKARDAAVQLNRISAKGASLVLASGKLEYISIDEIEPGQILRILAGERIPVDGKLLKGSSDLDCSLVTGESLPVATAEGSIVEAGTLNLTGAIEIQALRDAKHSFLAEVSRMMEAAEKGRGKFTRIADRMAQIYAPAVHILAALAFIGWMFATGGDWHTSIYIAISVLIITCPCALGLAVPVAHVIAARQLFKNGVIISDGEGFERMEQATHVIFDKTGTLTTGIPQVESTTIESDLEKEVVNSLAQHSSHPASNAIKDYLQDYNTVELTNIHELPGSGIRALFEGKEVRLGQENWVREISAKGATGIHQGVSFAIKDGEVSNFQLVEKLRQDAIAAISQLKSAGLGIEIVSGDNEQSVRAVAEELQILSFLFNQKPSDKIDRINRLHDRGEKVMMVGDGLNDSPAIAGAHVSIAPSNACDVGRHAADFVFTRKSLLAVPVTLNAAWWTGEIVKQNFAMAIIYNIIAVPFAVAGYVTPLTAAIAMSASSIVVVANSMRLSR